MLKKVYLLANIGTDTAENERKFAKICQKQIGNYPTPPRFSRRFGASRRCAARKNRAGLTAALKNGGSTMKGWFLAVSTTKSISYSCG